MGEFHTNFRLTSAGETLTLINSSFQVVDAVTFPPLVTDQAYGRNATGALVVFAVGQATPNAPNVAPATATPTPSPTATAAPGAPSLVFNEVMTLNNTTIADGAGDFEDWIELYNPTCATVALGGWTIRDDSASWSVPAGTSLAPGARLFVWASNKGDPADADFPGPAGELHTNFRLAGVGESLFLLDAAGLLVHTVVVPALIAEQSYARTSTGTYTTAFGADVTPNQLNSGQTPPVCAPTPTPTPGGPTATPAPSPTATPTPSPAATATPTPTATVTPVPSPTPGVCASAIRINELQSRNSATIADGDGNFSDWFELYNSGSSTIDLSGWKVADATNTWDLPTGTSIGAGQYLVVWASDKGDPDDEQFPGPAGELHTNFALSGSGERLSLVDTAGCLVSTLTSPDLATNESFGVTPPGPLGRFAPGWATPGSRNGDQRAPVRSTCYSPNSPIRMNRIVSRSGGPVLDADGDDSDFIELYNAGFDPVNLTAWQISDSRNRWIIPRDTIIDGYGTVIIWASGKGFVLDDRYPGPPGELHANFELSGDGEQVTLAEPSECIVEQLVYPELESGEAYGFDSRNQRATITLALPVTPTTGSCAATGSVVIAAAQSTNDATRVDEDGDRGDWLELRNTTDQPIELAGWLISDSGASWMVPDGVVLAKGETRVVWADDKDRGGATTALHTSFKLSSDGETLILAQASDCVVDRVAIPKLAADQIYRRTESGAFAVAGAAAPANKDDDKDNEDKDDNDDNDDSDGSVAGGVQVVGTCLAINEVMAKNESTLADDDGDFVDWIELVNLGDETIDLSGYQLSDEKDTWTIPDGVELGARRFLVVFADEKDRGGADEELQSNFKLSDEGEPITLVDTDGAVVASISSYPELAEDESFGVDGAGNYAVFPVGKATPGKGPRIADGCDFELTVGATEGNEGREDDDSAGSDEDGGADDSAAADDALPRTGSEAGASSFVAQLLILTGAVMVATTTIAQRRSMASRSAN